MVSGRRSRRFTCNPALLLLVLATLAASAQAAAQRELHVWVNELDRGREVALRIFESRHPDLRIVLSMYRQGNDAQKLMTAVVGGAPPDVVTQDRFSIGEWASRGALLRLDDLIERTRAAEQAGGAQGIDPADFYPACWAEGVYQGAVYGIPFSSDARALYYNEDLLRQAGFVDAEGQVVPPRDWDELRHYAVRLTQRDAAGRLTVLGFAPNYGNSWLYLYGWLNGGEFMVDDGRRVTLDDPRIIEALAYMRELYEAVGGVHAVDAFVSAATGPESDPFATGRLAMKIDGDWNLSFLTEYHPNMRFGVAPPPAPAGKPTVTWSGGFSYVIPATSRQPELAMELIRFLVSDEGWQIQHETNARYAASRGRAYVPRMTAQPAVNERVQRELVATNPGIPRRVAQALPLFAELMPVSRFRPVSPLGQLLWDEHVRAIERSVRGGEPPAEVLAAATHKVQQRLDRELNHAPHPQANVRNATAILAGILLFASVLLAVVVRRRQKYLRYRRDEVVAAAVFVSPWVIGFVVLTAGPILVSLVYSFCRYDVLHAPQWVGLANFRRLVTDEMFWRSLANTAYMLIGVPLGMAVGLAIAMLLNTEVRGMKLYRTLFYLPSIVPVVASSILWLWVLNPTNGLVNTALQMLGVRELPLWLASPSWLLGSKAAILLMGLWGAGGGMVIWLAGLKGIPPHLYEAAELDGAGPVRRFLHVTLPMLTPYIFFNLVMGTIGTMQIFTQAFVMTSGGPADSTLFYAYHLFNSAFRYFEMGYASAMAWVLLLMILGLTGLQMWSSRRWVQYDVV